MEALSLAYGTKKAVIKVFHVASEGERILVDDNELSALLKEDMIYFCDECKVFHIKDNWEHEIDKELEAIQRWLSERD